MLQLDLAKKKDGVFYLSNPSNQNFDEDKYISVRKSEGRLYPDSVVQTLPQVNFSHPLKKEWRVRKKSFYKLIKYFSTTGNKMFLEIGCGNGWLANGIAADTNNVVIGLDLNQIELKQAARIFGNNKRLSFAYGNIFEDIFPREVFDTIIFASSVQYFKSFSDLINRVFLFLKPDGEIHIIDSFFYDDKEIVNAINRTRQYYEKLGFPLMAENYFHHTWKELGQFNYKIRNAKFYSFQRQMKFFAGMNKVIFPWIKIKK